MEETIVNKLKKEFGAAVIAYLGDYAQKPASEINEYLNAEDLQEIAKKVAFYLSM